MNRINDINSVGFIETLKDSDNFIFVDVEGQL
jgi:hypothetical protein